MPIERTQYSEFLNKIAQDIDIPPSKYQQAVDRYQSVGEWLERGDYQRCTDMPSIYTQGSFRLGTVVRPIRSGSEADYDIDLVCELPIIKYLTDPKTVKVMIGDRIREHKTYIHLLDKEGRRCWTLEYAEQDGIGFHMDILPCVPDSTYGRKTEIAITDKQGNTYGWSASDPNGYAVWFDQRNKRAFEQVVAAQKNAIFRVETVPFASVDDVPDQLVRTPLQRSIQIMKRHRDVMFSNNDYGPISMIITTLAGHLYQHEMDMYAALVGIVSQLNEHAALIEGRSLRSSLTQLGLIQRLSDGTWYIRNPVNPKENFADRWHEDDHARARAFFRWVAKLKEDLVDIVGASRQNPKRVLSEALYIPASSSRLDLISTEAPAATHAPRIYISEGPKPWRV